MIRTEVVSRPYAREGHDAAVAASLTGILGVVLPLPAGTGRWANALKWRVTVRVVPTEWRFAASVGAGRAGRTQRQPLFLVPDSSTFAPDLGKRGRGRRVMPGDLVQVQSV